MDIPRGHAMLPLAEADILDFIYNYFKAEYAPIRSLWSTATAEPKQPTRWVNMGRELVPLSIRAANAQAQKDLESLDYFIRQRNLDPVFVHGIVIRYAMFELHERLEKKMYECARLDLMVRKALKEKHLIDALWPSPAPKNIPQELLSQGVQVRRWYGDMFTKYFTVLHSVDDFRLRPEVDAKIKSSGTLMLLPYVDHLIMGGVDPIRPIVAKGSGYSSVKRTKKDARTAGEALSFGEPDRFEIRFDAPSEVTETYTKSVVRQCQCMKCGSKRDVQVVISVDPNPGPVTRSSELRSSQSVGPPPTKRQPSKTAQRYSPGYNMPVSQKEDVPPPQPPRPQHQEASPPSGEKKKQCPRCTFLNHAELTSCEMCQGELPDSTIVAKPPSPPSMSVSKASHAHSKSQPSTSKPNDFQEKKEKSEQRPATLNRHSISSTLFSIFPFSQQHQQEHHANLPPTQPTTTDPSAAISSDVQPKLKYEDKLKPLDKGKQAVQLPRNQTHETEAQEPSTSASHKPVTPSTPPNLIDEQPEAPFSRAPEMAMMPLTPPGTADEISQSQHHLHPAGMPQNLMDDFVPVSPSFPREAEDEDAGWGEMSRAEANDSSDDDEDDDVNIRREGMVDLDAVAREEMGVWGDRED